MNEKDVMQETVEKIIDSKLKSKVEFTEKIKQVLFYLGYVLSIIGAVGYFITILTIVFGVGDLDFQLIGKDGLFFLIGLVFGFWVRAGLYLQGVIYSKRENEAIIKEYYELRVKDKPENKRKSFEFVMTMEVIRTTILQITSFAITSLGLVYLAGFEGINNPIYIGNALSNLVMFAGFGLLALVSTYEKYNELKIPVIKERVRLLKLKQAEKEKVVEPPLENEPEL